MYEAHESIDCPSHDQVIWRYMDLWKFLDLIDNQKLYLSRTDLLADKYEGTVPRQSIVLESLNTHSEKYLKENVYISCWTTRKYEDYALWKIYTDYRTAIAIKSTVARLVESISDNKSIQRIGLVKYVNHSDDYVFQDNYYQYFYEKRNFFSYEHELRLLTDKVEGIFDDFIETTMGLYINVKSQALIEEIYLAPMADLNLKNLIELKLKNIGLEVPIRFSKI